VLFSLRISSLCLVLLGGCATANLIGTRDSDGFTSASYPLHVSGRSSAFDGQLWTLENVQPTGKTGELVSKLGENYERTVTFDTDGNGSYETVRRLWNDELSLRHRRSNALMSLSVLPMDQNMAETDMDVLVRNYVDAVSGGGSVSVNIGAGARASKERRFATRILDSAVFTVDGEPAAGATFEVANVDQLELSKEARWERAQVVLIRAPWRTVAGVERKSTWPTLIRALYSSRSESFEAHEGDFADFVRAIDFAGHRPAIDAQATHTKACFEEPMDGMELVLTVGTEGGIDDARLVKDDGQSQPVDAGVFESLCVERALKATKLSPVPASFDVAWPINREGKVIASVGVPDGTVDFSAGAWPPRTAALADKTAGGETAISEGPLPAAPVAPSPTPTEPAADPAPMPNSSANSAIP